MTWMVRRKSSEKQLEKRRTPGNDDVKKHEKVERRWRKT